MMCARFFHARLAWVIMTPLGRPVVPDVYIKRWMSSGRCRGAWAALCCRRADRRSVSSRRQRSAKHARTNERVLDAVCRFVGKIDERFVTDERASSGVLEDVPHLWSGEPPVDRHRDRAEVVRGEDRLEELGAVVGEERHDIATSDATFAQPAGQPLDASGHLCRR